MNTRSSPPLPQFPGLQSPLQGLPLSWVLGSLSAAEPGWAAPRSRTTCHPCCDPSHCQKGRERIPRQSHLAPTSPLPHAHGPPQTPNLPPAGQPLPPRHRRPCLCSCRDVPSASLRLGLGTGRPVNLSSLMYSKSMHLERKEIPSPECSREGRPNVETQPPPHLLSQGLMPLWSQLQSA